MTAPSPPNFTSGFRALAELPSVNQQLLLSVVDSIPTPDGWIPMEKLSMGGVTHNVVQLKEYVPLKESVSMTDNVTVSNVMDRRELVDKYHDVNSFGSSMSNSSVSFPSNEASISSFLHPAPTTGPSLPIESTQESATFQSSSELEVPMSQLSSSLLVMPHVPPSLVSQPASEPSSSPLTQPDVYHLRQHCARLEMALMRCNEGRMREHQAMLLLQQRYNSLNNDNESLTKLLNDALTENQLIRAAAVSSGAVDVVKGRLIDDLTIQVTTLSHQFSLSQRQVADVVSYTRDLEASIGDIEKAADVQVARQNEHVSTLDVLLAAKTRQLGDLSHTVQELQSQLGSHADILRQREQMLQAELELKQKQYSDVVQSLTMAEEHVKDLQEKLTLTEEHCMEQQYALADLSRKVIGWEAVATEMSDRLKRMSQLGVGQVAEVYETQLQTLRAKYQEEITALKQRVGSYEASVNPTLATPPTSPDRKISDLDVYLFPSASPMCIQGSGDAKEAETMDLGDREAFVVALLTLKRMEAQRIEMEKKLDQLITVSRQVCDDCDSHGGQLSALEAVLLAGGNKIRDLDRIGFMMQQVFLNMNSNGNDNTIHSEKIQCQSPSVIHHPASTPLPIICHPPSTSVATPSSFDDVYDSVKRRLSQYKRQSGNSPYSSVVGHPSPSSPS